MRARTKERKDPPKKDTYIKKEKNKKKTDKKGKKVGITEGLGMIL